MPSRLSRLARAAVSAVALGALAVSLATTGPDATAAGRTHAKLPVTGYAGDWTLPATIDAQAPALSIVGVDGIGLALAGNGVAAPTPGALELLATSHADGLRADLLVANDAVASLATVVANRLLRSARHRRQVVRQLVHLVRVQGWNGITVDIEALAAGDAQGLVGFVAALRAHLPRRDQVAVDVSATPSLAEYPAIGYHLRGLSKVADVVLMAYDEDGPWSGPGPIGGLPWQRASIAAVLHEVPRSRLVLGVAAYGYTWPRGARVHDGVGLSDAQARQLAAASGRKPRWIPRQGEWTVRLRNGTVLWWSDVRSYRERFRLAVHDRLGGLAVWQLASADRLPAR
jgi:spore germination protein YaaH